MASKSAMPSGYEYEFVQEVPDEYICVICQHVMKKPVQMNCGHRFCRSCVDQSNPQCPVEKTPTKQEIFEDMAAERKILSLEIKCPEQSCEWKGELKSFENHDKQCDYKTIPCTYQNIGCGFKVKRKDLNDHIQNRMKHHLTIAIEKIQTLITEAPTKDDGMHYSYIWKVKDFNQQLDAAKKSGRDIELYSEPFYTHKYGYKLKLELDPNGRGDGKGTHVSAYLVVMRGEYDALLTWPFDWKFKFILMDQKPNPSQRKNIEFSFTPDDSTSDVFQRRTTDDNTGYGFEEFASQEILATENYIVDSELFLKVEFEKPQHVNPPTMRKDDEMHYSYTWKVKDFNQQLEAAKKSAHDIRLDSEPFYTHKYGYKLKLRLDPNGCGDGEGTHVSASMVVMRGEYDALLTWPFGWKVKFILMNQKPNPSQQKNIEMSFTPDKSWKEFQRPTTNQNTSFGFSQFASQEILPSEKYVVDGTLFLKLELEKP